MQQSKALSDMKHGLVYLSLNIFLWCCCWFKRGFLEVEKLFSSKIELKLRYNQTFNNITDIVINLDFLNLK